MEQYGANAATYSTYQETCWMASDFGADCSDVKTDVSLGRPPINKPNLVTIIAGSQTISALQCWASCLYITVFCVWAEHSRKKNDQWFVLLNLITYHEIPVS